MDRFDKVSIRDNTTEVIDSLFNQEVSVFTLATDTTASTATTLVYTFTATGGHGLAAGNEILLLDVVGDVAFQAVVTNVATDTITLDRPIDNIFPSATSLCRIVTSNMAVDGSVTPQIFTFRSGTAAVNMNRLMLTILSGTTVMDDGKFGNIAALANGLILRTFNGTHKTIFNFKTNQDIKQWCYDVNYAANAAAGNTGLSSRITFNGPDKHGVALALADTEVLQWIVQDDLTGLTVVRGSIQGRKME